MEQLQQAGAANQVFVAGTPGVFKKKLPDHLGASGSVASVCLADDGRHRGFGPTQAQHSGSGDGTAGVSLLDILRQVPTLPELMPPDSKMALSATCKSCRLQFIAQVQVVTVLRQEDHALVIERRWPRLCMVIQYQDAFCAVSPPSSLTRIINVQISYQGYSRATISMLRPLHHLATDLPWTHLAAQQLAHHMRRWPLMNAFTMSQAHNLDGLGLCVISQLVKGTWIQLVYLSLSECDLKAEALLLLSQGNWPRLKWLDVSGNCLDAEGMALLAKGNWPLLIYVTLSFDPTMGAAAISHLSAANWQTANLVIKDTAFSADMAAQLANLQLPKLKVLHLRGSGLMAAAVSELARADWPSLENLRIDHDDLDAVAVLLGVDLGKVQELKDNAGILAVCEPRMPDMVLWPNLSWISITKGNVHLSSK